MQIVLLQGFKRTFRQLTKVKLSFSVFQKDNSGRDKKQNIL
ncbi:hypothetical protein HMPREF3213_01589 [Heyndrickxia coagulans]|uniref:Uncharacterized protein n=1 Tax=Heyndrickxia coagulans TaxID=1398 RepID=A0A133KT23_HEYCO|nr:hypothetical protein HMPREF3213_01589 [Heyndrickxia coagulans]